MDGALAEKSERAATERIATSMKNPNGNTQEIHLRVHPCDKRNFERAASLAGVTLSKWIRSRLTEQAKAELGEEYVEKVKI